MELSILDSERVQAIMRQIPRGTYTESTLRTLISRTQAERPKVFHLKDVLPEIRRTGWRWGVTYDTATDKYLAWSGKIDVHDRIPYNPLPAKIITTHWKPMIDDIIRHMPDTHMAFSTFVQYFSIVSSNLGYTGKYGTLRDVTGAILTQQIEANVTIEPGNRVNVWGGRTDGTPRRDHNRRY